MGEGFDLAETDRGPEGQDRELRDFGPFEIIGKIGSGAAGVVYRARHKTMDKIVALKILSRRLSDNPRFIKRFIAEARAAGRLSHPNIVRGIDVGEVGGRYYFSMEIVEGKDLDLILADGPLPERRALEIALDISRALVHAFGKGIIHRDVKPSNIMIDRENRALLTDMGLARRDDAESLEKEGAVLGTPDYMSPEQARGAADVDTRSDVYSLGITLFQMIAGKPPFTGGTPKEVLARHIGCEMPHPADFGAQISQGAWDLILRMTAKDREDRPADPALLAGELEAVLAGPSVPAARPSRRTAARRPWRRRAKGAEYLYVLAGAAVIFIAGIVVMSSIGGDDEAADAPDPKPGARPRPPADATEVPKPVRPGADEGAEEEMRRILDAYARNPGGHEEAAARLKELAGKISPDLASVVWKEIEKIRAAALDRFKASLADLKKAVAGRLSAGDFKGAAGAVSDFRDANAGSFGSQEAFQGVEALDRDVGKAAEAEAETLESRIDSLLTNDRYEEAMRLAEKLRSIGTAGMEARAQAAHKTISASKAAWEESKALEREKAALAGARAEAFALARSRDFAGAVRVFEGARAAIKDRGLWSEASREIRDIDDLVLFLKAAGGPENRAAGLAMEIQGRKGEISKVEGGKVFLKSGGVQVGVRIEDMTPAELSAVAEAGLDFPGNPSLRKGYAIYHMTFGEGAKALEILGSMGLPAEELEYYKAKAGRAGGR